MYLNGYFLNQIQWNFISAGASDDLQATNNREQSAGENDAEWKR